MELQIFGDRTLRKLAFSHAVHKIHRMNQKHKNEAQNRKLQNIIFLMLQACAAFLLIPSPFLSLHDIVGVNS